MYQHETGILYFVFVCVTLDALVGGFQVRRQVGVADFRHLAQPGHREDARLASGAGAVQVRQNVLLTRHLVVFHPDTPADAHAPVHRRGHQDDLVRPARGVETVAETIFVRCDNATDRAKQK